MSNVIPDFVILERAAKIARARADELKLIADAAHEAFDEADSIASDAEDEANDWAEVVRGDVSMQEYFELKNGAERDQFSF